MTHTCTRHQPGTPACYYTHACRCTPCRHARTRQLKRSRAGHGPKGPLVPAGPVRDRIDQLTAAGYSLDAIAKTAGITYPHAKSIATQRRVSAEVARRILTSPIPDRGTVDPAPTNRRVAALVCAGWSIEHLARRCGVARPSLTVSHQRKTVAVAGRVAAVYEELWDKQPPDDTPQDRRVALRNRRRAIRLGYAPALAWDDGYGPHGIDNPAATPIGMVTAGDLGTRGRTADIIERIEMGYCMADLQSLGYRETALERALIRADRYDLWATIRPGDVGGAGRNQHTKTPPQPEGTQP